MSVRKRTWTTADGEHHEAWLIDYRDASGKRIVEQGFRTMADAKAKLAEVTVDVGKGHTVEKNLTLGEACQKWISKAESNGMQGHGAVEKATLRNYKEHVAHIEKRLGANIKLSKLTRDNVEKFMDRLLKELPRPTARGVFRSFKSMLRSIGRSHVADGLTIGKSKRSKPIEAGVDFPTPAEVKRLAAAATDVRVRALFLTAALCGLRGSELRGLRWRDVNFDAAELHVRQRADRFREIGAPKSSKSTRAIPLEPAKLVPALKEWKMKCPKAEADLVFPRASGAVMGQTSMCLALDPLMIEAGVVDKKGQPKYSLHKLRHFFASWCISPSNRGGRGLSPKETQNLLGHSSIAMTLDIYGHLLPSEGHGDLAKSAAALLG
jgi:integrase